jgi:hypothetical protein
MVQGSGFRVQVEVQGAGFRVQFRMQGRGLRVQSAGLRVEGVGYAWHVGIELVASRPERHLILVQPVSDCVFMGGGSLFGV